MMRAARATINLAALRHNFQRVREAAPDSRVLAVIKANAYGHGLTTIAQALAEADGFGVACVNEALLLRAAGTDKPIVSLQGFKDKEELIEAAARSIEVVVHSDYQLRLLASSELHYSFGVWLKIDTGMARLGFEPRRAASTYRVLCELPQVTATPVLMTHLSCADDLTSPCTPRQLALFDRAIDGLPGARSVANSAGILAWPNSHREWVRPGIMLYGASPFGDDDAARLGLKPVMTLTAPLLAVKQLNAGDGIGYAGAWVCPESMRVGVAATGYADGYPRHATAGTPVLVNGRRTQIIGRVCMDMLMIDLRGINARPGDQVTLWGEGLSVDEVARHAGTVGYELLSAVGGRANTDFSS
jgi:alanine racemase